MSDQLSADDWVDAGLKALAAEGFLALKAERLAKSLGVSRGSFYWHFADLASYHAAVLARWREVAAEQIIGNLESFPTAQDALRHLLSRSFTARLALEQAVRSWATTNTLARAAVVAIDRRRLDYVENLLRRSGLPNAVAQARAQVLYWAFVGFALSGKPLAKAQQPALLDGLLEMALAQHSTTTGPHEMC